MSSYDAGNADLKSYQKNSLHALKVKSAICSPPQNDEFYLRKNATLYRLVHFENYMHAHVCLFQDERDPYHQKAICSNM